MKRKISISLLSVLAVMSSVFASSANAASTTPTSGLNLTLATHEFTSSKSIEKWENVADQITKKLEIAERELVGTEGVDLKTTGLRYEVINSHEDRNYYMSIYSYNPELVYKEKKSDKKTHLGSLANRNKVCQEYFEEINQKPTVVYAELHQWLGLFKGFSCDVQYIEVEKVQP